MKKIEKYYWRLDTSIRGPYILLTDPKGKTKRKRIYFPGPIIFIKKVEYYLYVNGRISKKPLVSY